MSQVATLPDGNVTVSMSSTRGGAVLPGASMSLAKDVVAPGAPAISPNGGAIAGVTPISLSGNDELRYTVGNGNQVAPTASSGLVFNAQFNVVPGQTVKAIAVDAAGNESSVATAAFTQAATPPVVTPPVVTPPVVRPPVVTPPGGGSAAIIALAPGIANAKSGKPGGNDTATAKWRTPLANGAVLNGYEVRALKMRPGRSAKVRPAVVVEDRDAKKLHMSLPAGKYRFQVRAVGPAGKSPWSERSNQFRTR